MCYSRCWVCMAYIVVPLLDETFAIIHAVYSFGRCHIPRIRIAYKQYPHARNYFLIIFFYLWIWCVHCFDGCARNIAFERWMWKYCGVCVDGFFGSALEMHLHHCVAFGYHLKEVAKYFVHFLMLCNIRTTYFCAFHINFSHKRVNYYYKGKVNCMRLMIMMKEIFFTFIKRI